MTVSVFDFEAELGACAAGDRAAFLALYHHESPAMRALALAMLDDPDAADAVLHETFVLIWRNAAGYSPAIGTARAWIYSILRYRASAHARQMRAEGRHPVLALAILDALLDIRARATATSPAATRQLAGLTADCANYR